MGSGRREEYIVRCTLAVEIDPWGWKVAGAYYIKSVLGPIMMT